MRRWLKYWSYALNVLLAVILIWVVSRDDAPKPIPLSNYTQQDVDKAVQITRGMKLGDLQKLMGSPIKKEIAADNEEWHYCRTGDSVDEYVAVRLQAGAVVEVEQYTVTFLDILFHHTATPSKEIIGATGFGDCKLKIRWGSYGQKMPQGRVQSGTQQSVTVDRATPTEPAKSLGR